MHTTGQRIGTRKGRTTHPTGLSTQLTDSQQHNKRHAKDALLQAERAPFTAQYVPFRHAI